MSYINYIQATEQQENVTKLRHLIKEARIDLICIQNQSDNLPKNEYNRIIRLEGKMMDITNQIDDAEDAIKKIQPALQMAFN